MIPVQERLAGLHRHHLDTVLHRAGDLAQVAAHALLIDHLILVSAIRLLEAGHGLVRGVLTSDMAATATDTSLLIDFRDHLVVDVQVLPVRGVAHRAAGKLRNAGVALTVHPA
ncbi:hypothetical protein D3C72_2078630 [compost metagenome]